MRALLPLLILLLGASPALGQRPFRAQRDAMGTSATVLIYAETREAADPLFEVAFSEIERIEQLLSDYRDGSELSRLNSATDPVTLDPEMMRILNRALAWARDTGGAFDPTVGALMDARRAASEDSVDGGSAGAGPSLPDIAARHVGWQHVDLDLLTREFRWARAGVRLDPGAFGKGYALEAAASALREAGVSSALLEMGRSSYRAIGAPPRQSGWLIHLDDPTEGGTLTTSVLLNDEALSTSGNLGPLGVHVLDPRSGEPAEAALQVTVIAPDAMDADILSTALLVLGPDASRPVLAAVPRVRSWMLYEAETGTTVASTRWQAAQ